jgi:hypothetical protein
MFDKARDWMNNNSSIVTVVSVVILLGALAFIVTRGRRGGGGGPGEAYYYDTVANEYFTDVTTKVAPFNNNKGNESVRAHFFTCAECTTEIGKDGKSNQRFIGYYEKYTPEVKAKIEEKSDSFMIYEMAFQGRLYSKDGKKWVAADKPEGIQITSDLQKECPPKKLRYCPPS